MCSKATEANVNPCPLLQRAIRYVMRIRALNTPCEGVENNGHSKDRFQSAATALRMQTTVFAAQLDFYKLLPFVTFGIKP